MNSVKQQHEHHHYKVLVEWSHLWISLDSSGFRSFLGLVKFAFGSERVKSQRGWCFVVQRVLTWRARLHYLYIMKYLMIHVGVLRCMFIHLGLCDGQADLIYSPHQWEIPTPTPFIPPEHVVLSCSLAQAGKVMTSENDFWSYGFYSIVWNNLSENTCKNSVHIDGLQSIPRESNDN